MNCCKDYWSRSRIWFQHPIYDSISHCCCIHLWKNSCVCFGSIWSIVCTEFRTDHCHTHTHKHTSEFHFMLLHLFHVQSSMTTTRRKYCHVDIITNDSDRSYSSVYGHDHNEDDHHTTSTSTTLRESWPWPYRISNIEWIDACTVKRITSVIV